MRMTLLPQGENIVVHAFGFEGNLLAAGTVGIHAPYLHCAGTVFLGGKEYNLVGAGKEGGGILGSRRRCQQCRFAICRGCGGIDDRTAAVLLHAVVCYSVDGLLGLGRKVIASYAAHLPHYLGGELV